MDLGIGMGLNFFLGVFLSDTDLRAPVGTPAVSLAVLTLELGCAYLNRSTWGEFLPLLGRRRVRRP